MKTVWQKGPDLRDDSGVYHYGGRSYISVTTALSGHGDLTWVHAWAIERLVTELGECAKSGEPYSRWVEHPVVSPDGEIVGSKFVMEESDPSVLLADGQYISRAGFRYLKQCSDRGELLHDIMEDYARGNSVNSTDRAEVCEYAYDKLMGSHRTVDIDEYLDMAQRLVEWLEIYKPKILFSEAPVFSSKHEYAGRFDLIMDVGGEMLLVDLKSSTSYQRTWSAQVSAYTKGDLFLVNSGSSGWLEIDMPALDGGAVLMLDRKRCFLRKVTNLDEAFNELFLPSLHAAKSARSLPLPSKAKSMVHKAAVA